MPNTTSLGSHLTAIYKDSTIRLFNLKFSSTNLLKVLISLKWHIFASILSNNSWGFILEKCRNRHNSFSFCSVASRLISKICCHASRPFQCRASNQTALVVTLKFSSGALILIIYHHLRSSLNTHLWQITIVVTFITFISKEVIILVIILISNYFN